MVRERGVDAGGNDAGKEFGRKTKEGWNRRRGSRVQTAGAEKGD